MGGDRGKIADMVDDLVVFDFNSDNLPRKVAGWKQNTAAPFGQNCRRNLYYGFTEDFNKFPEDHLDRAYTKCKGVDAYAYLLQFAAGYEHGRYRTHNTHQFFRTWSESTRNHPDTGEKYKRLVSILTSDSKFIQKHITDHYKEQRKEIIARDLSGLKRGDDVLVVGSLDDQGDLSAFTSGMIRTAESKQKGRKGFITLTHPDNEKLAAMKDKVHEINGGKHPFHSGISYADPDEIALAIEMSDKVYIALPMGAVEGADQVIVDAWQNRVRRDNVLTHFHSNPLDKGVMTPAWEQAKLDKFVSPIDIREENVARGDKNAEVIVKAEQAIWNCAQLRSQGLPLMKNDFFDRYPDLEVG